MVLHTVPSPDLAGIVMGILSMIILGLLWWKVDDFSDGNLK